MADQPKQKRFSPTYLLPIGISIGFLFLYLITTNQIFSFDAVTNAIACESNEMERWFHSNHLFYPFLGVAYYRVEKFLGYMGYSIYSLARFNSFLMALSLGLFFWSLRKKVQNILALSATLFLGVTYSVWHYAVDGRAIGASVFFSVLTILWLFHLEHKGRVEKFDAVVLAFFSYLTVMMHGISIFHIIPITYFLVKFHVLLKQKVSGALIYLGLVSLLILTTYGTVFFIITKSNQNSSFINWCIGYAGHQGTNEILNSPFWTKNLTDLITGLWEGWINSLLKPVSGSRLINLISKFTGIIILVLVGISLVKKSSQSPTRNLLIGTLLGWGGLITIFLAFWSPGQEGFRLHVIVPWMVAVVLSLSDKGFLHWIFISLASLTFYFNFTQHLYPSAFIQRNEGFQLLSEIEKKVNKNDLVLTGPKAVIPGIEVLLPYFFPNIRGGSLTGRLFAFNESSLEPLKKRIEIILKEGHSVYLSEDLFEPQIALLIEKDYRLKPGEMAEFILGYKTVEFFTLSNRRIFYRVEIKS